MLPTARPMSDAASTSTCVGPRKPQTEARGTKRGGFGGVTSASSEWTAAIHGRETPTARSRPISLPCSRGARAQAARGGVRGKRAQLFKFANDAWTHLLLWKHGGGKGEDLLVDVCEHRGGEGEKRDDERDRRRSAGDLHGANPLEQSATHAGQQVCTK